MPLTTSTTPSSPSTLSSPSLSPLPSPTWQTRENFLPLQWSCQWHCHRLWHVNPPSFLPTLCSFFDRAKTPTFSQQATHLPRRLFRLRRSQSHQKHRARKTRRHLVHRWPTHTHANELGSSFLCTAIITYVLLCGYPLSVPTTPPPSPNKPPIPKSNFWQVTSALNALSDHRLPRVQRVGAYPGACYGPIMVW